MVRGKAVFRVPTQWTDGRFAYGCWAGTRKAKVSLRLVVHKFKGKDAYGGGRVTDEWSYFSPQLASLGTFGSAGRSIDYQDRPACDGDWGSGTSGAIS